MVRVKEKARKGDDAFKKRKQKVGRKKLAPATATRAEVHARTLRVTTPTAITRGGQESEAIEAGEERPAVSAGRLHKDFKEHLVGTRHYKKAVRAAAFTSLTRALAAHFSAVGRGVKDPAREGNEMELSPLEILHAYTGALDAMTDTDDDVRQAAVGTLKVILHGRKPALQVDTQKGTAVEGVSYPGVESSADVCGVDQARAALRTVDVTLTHAMMSVRRSGAELLQLILQVHPHGVRTVLGESTAWVKMASRISSIALPSTNSGSGKSPSMKMFHVVADLLEAMMPQHSNVDGASGEVALLTQHTAGRGVDKQQKDEVSLPSLVAQFFEECSPRWCVAWKELMELRAALFRDVEWVRHATAVARAFGCCAMYLRDHRLLGRSNLRLIHHLFTVKVPFTMHELIVPSRSGAASSSRWRFELATAVAGACLPLAYVNDDAWEVLHNFLTTIFNPGEDGDSADGESHVSGGGKVRKATQLVGPIRILRTAVLRFRQVLLPRLLPIVPHMLRVVTQTVTLGDGSDAERSALVGVLRMLADVLSVVVTSQAAAGTPRDIGNVRDAALAVPRLFFAMRTLQLEPACLDSIVFSLLHPLWRAASSGHPLLTLPASGKQKNTALQQLSLSLTSLFEINVPDGTGKGTYKSIAGVLQRCSDRTVELAVHTLFYVGGAVPRTSWVRESGVLSLPVLIDTLPQPSVCGATAVVPTVRVHA